MLGVFDRARPGQGILVVSCGLGSSYAVGMFVRDQIDERRNQVVSLEECLKRKEYIDYPTYLK